MQDSLTFILVLLVIVAIETSYLTYRSLRKTAIAKNTSVFVDTSVLIDGRIVSVAETGFLPGDLVIPRSVIAEMQFLADKADNDKRERARRGLDVVRELQDLSDVTVTILPDSQRPEGGVDQRLLELAKQYGGSVLTIDYNLIKVALVEDITVLNINDLAKKLRMSYLPGDMLRLELTQSGSDSHQAVGHLSDGTMVVVENANKDIGKTVDIEIIRSLQTSAGKMMFARKRTNDSSSRVNLQAARQAPAKLANKTRGQKPPKAIPTETHETGSQKSNRQKPQRNAQSSRKGQGRAQPRPSSEDSLLQSIQNQRS